jgi:adenylate kinase family enzyme
VVGTAGWGKTTLARRLADVLGCPHVELDALYWGREWEPATREGFRARTAQALGGDAWTVDGNYSIVRDIIHDRSDTVVWLDYWLPRILARLVRRTLRRVLLRELLWGVNRESLRSQLGRDSLLVYAVRTHGRRRRTYLSTQEDPDLAHLTFIRLRNPRETDRWLSAVASTCRAGNS